MSSGQQPQNPLLLLGQYSDDEVDEGLSKGPNDAKVGSPMPNEEVFYYLHFCCQPEFLFCLTNINMLLILMFMILIISLINFPIGVEGFGNVEWPVSNFSIFVFI